MSDLKLEVGGVFEDESSRRLVDAWRRAEQGEVFQERYITFESWEGLARTLTAKRVALLRHVRRHGDVSVRSLAKALGRDYSNVHADVRLLANAGLLEAGSNGVRADYDGIETRIAI